MKETFEVYYWADAVKRFWATIMNLVSFVIVEFSDSLLSILLSGFVLIAPLPNAISVYSLAQNQLKFEWYTAFAFSAAIEFGPFVMIAISLKLFDGLLRQGKRWMVPFALSVVGTIVVIAVIMVVVYRLEDANQEGQNVMALLPLISICAFIGLGALAWHKAQPEILTAEQEEQERLRQQKLLVRKDELGQELIEIDHQQKLELMSAKHGKAMQKFAGPQTAKPLNAEADRKPQTANFAQTLPLNTAVEPQIAVGGATEETENPFADTLRWIAENQPVTVKQVADQLKVTKPTASKVLKQLVAENRLKEIQEGQKYLYGISG